MINIAIVDDDINFIKILEKKLYILDNKLKIICYTNPFDFIEDVNNIDYVLLDIGLPQLDGITLSKQLRNYNISIFFITEHKELMIKSFGKNVEGFILKENLDEGLSNFIQFVNKNKNSDFFTVLIQHQELRIFFSKILFIQYNLRDVEFIFTNKKRFVQKNVNLKDIIKQLNNDFILINRNTVVNINYIEYLKNNYIYIRGYKFKVSRRKIKNIKIKLLERELNNEFGSLY